MRTTLPHIALHLVIACGTFAAGYAIHAAPPLAPVAAPSPAVQPSLTRPAPAPIADVHRLRDASKSFTRPLLECDQDEQNFAELHPLQKQVTSLIESKVQRGEALSLSAYYRELDSGHWFGVNEGERFSPASLLKVPVLIAILAMAERQPGLLAEKVVAPESLRAATDPFYPPEVELQAGIAYSVDELLAHMITYSDNNAKDLLMSRLDQAVLDATYARLGIEVPSATTAADFITAQDIGRFFQVLYNATYLSREMSEKALGLLATCRFKAGLAAGVPAGTVVAHKFGLRVREDATLQLHDCGIVYAPHRPYLLCVMGRGAKGIDLAPVIRDVSREVYDGVTRPAPAPASH